ncbi:hypothetical protein [Paraburkholderia sp. HP33-1]|uniref:hypothetical protein n=1 Tax=Paraburkholderia sp. HP33-1 TaxID=2883243 RepID=UPI001F2D3A10|nr:hypothetical protein [Paraburkholderia sp. HP33-1]
MPEPLPAAGQIHEAPHASRIEYNRERNFPRRCGTTELASDAFAGRAAQFERVSTYRLRCI